MRHALGKGYFHFGFLVNCVARRGLNGVFLKAFSTSLSEYQNRMEKEIIVYKVEGVNLYIYFYALDK